MKTQSEQWCFILQMGFEQETKKTRHMELPIGQLAISNYVHCLLFSFFFPLHEI